MKQNILVTDVLLDRKPLILNVYCIPSMSHNSLRSSFNEVKACFMIYKNSPMIIISLVGGLNTLSFDS